MPGEKERVVALACEVAQKYSPSAQEEIADTPAIDFRSFVRPIQGQKRFEIWVPEPQWPDCLPKAMRGGKNSHINKVHIFSIGRLPKP